MTQPTPLLSTAQLNGWVYHHADSQNLRSSESPEKMGDPSVAQVRQDQQPSRGQQAGDFAMNAAQQLISSSTTRVGFVMGAAAPLITGVQLYLRMVEAGEQGEALKRAFTRDAMHLAVLNLVANELPPAFVERAAHELRASKRGADVMLTSMAASPEYEDYRTAQQRHAQRGMLVAANLGIVDGASLATARQDPAFDTQFRTDPAFRFGVRAALFNAQNGNGQ